MFVRYKFTILKPIAKDQTLIWAKIFSESIRSGHIFKLAGITIWHNIYQRFFTNFEF